MASFRGNPLFSSIFSLCFLSLLSMSSSTDTITSNSYLSGTDQIIFSAQKQFALGFYQPPNSSYWYISIWYNTIPVQTSVFIANRNAPLTDPATARLTIGSDGNLVLRNGSNTEVWSTNVTGINPSNKTEAVLNDGGNLQLRYVSNTSDVLWQSVDHPTDTWLPGGKLGLNKTTGISQRLISWKNSADPAEGIYSLLLDPNGTSQYFIQWNKTIGYWTSSYWSDTQRIFVDVPEMTENYIYNFTYVSNKEENYFIYSVKPDSGLISRFIMDYSGQIKQLNWIDTSRQWIQFWSQPKQTCDVYALCGPYGSCNGIELPSCNCLHGFSQKSKTDYSLEDYRGGCVRNTQLQCESGNLTKVQQDKFYVLNIMKYPENSQSIQVNSAQECESACLKNCSCSAHSYQTGCNLWYGGLLNLQEGYRGSSAGTLYLRLDASEFTASKSHMGLIIGVVICGIIAVLFCIIVVLVVIKRKRDQRRAQLLKESKGTLIVPHSSGRIQRIKKYFLGPSQFANELEDGEKFELPLFAFGCLATATNNFGTSNLLGKGGFGFVFKGNLPGGEEIAVKRLSATSGQGIEEFKNEVILIAKLQHRNLVRLLGCCIQGKEKLLVYEYLPNKSLDAFLFDASKKVLLDWKTRFNIIEGSARGLLYLHRDSRLRVVHRDLKASNILLDKDMEPKISDFGLARIFGGDQNQENTNRVVGTLGYMSPEYAMQGIFSVKSDVYSFGILLLEIIIGERISSFHSKDDYLNIVGYAYKLWYEEKASDLIDPTIKETCSVPEVITCIQVALLCVQDLAHDRPEIQLVIKMITSKNPSLPLPRQPNFTLQGCSSKNNGMSNRSNSMSACDVTITRFQGR